MVAISSKGRTVLEEAQDIEKNLTNVADSQGYELRRPLQAIIRYLTSIAK
ncbi:hypothetical protein [Arthrobacter sp. 147(2020)]